MPVVLEQRSLQGPAEAVKAVEAAALAMAEAGYGEDDVFAVRLALGEALSNALNHGCKGDPWRQVRVSYRVLPDRVLAEVEDDGPGFNPGRVPDPRGPETLERPGGRGLFLMRSYMTWVRHNDRGNRVLLCRERSGPFEPPDKP